MDNNNIFSFMRKEYKQLLLRDLCARLPYSPKGIMLPDGETERLERDVVLKEVRILGDNEAILGFEGGWSCPLERFIPVLRPITSIYEEVEPGIVPWLIYHKEEMEESVKRILNPGEKMPEYKIISYKFDPPHTHSLWRPVEIKYWDEKNQKEQTLWMTATFKDTKAVEVGYRYHIDISGLLDHGLAQEWKEEQHS